MQKRKAALRMHLVLPVLALSPYLQGRNSRRILLAIGHSRRQSKAEPYLIGQSNIIFL